MPLRFALLTAFAAVCLGQEAGHHEITLDSQTLSRYAGAYRVAGADMLVTVENNQLFAKLGNQPAMPLFAESKTVFFTKGTNLEIEFAKEDGAGRPTELIVHQGGRNLTGPRLDDAQAKALTDAQADFAARLKNQTPAPGSEAVVRAAIAGFQSGKFDWERMSPRLAEVTREQLPELQASILKLGSLQSVTFKGVGPAGPDIYLARFEKGAIEYRVWLAPDGKVSAAGFRPVDAEVSVDSVRPRLPQIDSAITAEFARRPVGSVTAGVIVGKQLIWTKSYGQADMEKKIAADADTEYRIGSITKMFTAVMLDQLVERGKVHLSDPVEKYFPEVDTVLNRPAAAPPITLIELATHTSGLGREPDNTDVYVTGPVASWEKTLISALPHTHYILEPGTRFSYSNIGYAILGAALSRAAGEAYVDYVPMHIFEPLGMTHTALESNAQIAAHLAKGYQVMGGEVDSTTAQRENETGRGYKVPNGAIYTTVGDLAHFASLMMGEGPESVLKNATLARIENESVVPADSELTHGYGIGFQVDRRDDYVAFGHGGAVAGYTSALLLNQKIRVGVIVFSSGAANPGAIAQRALDVLSK